MCATSGQLTAKETIRNAHAWFELNSGWAPPDADTIADWAADGVCRSPDDCLVTPDGWCEHGLASWCLILAAEPDWFRYRNPPDVQPGL